jgi:ABC-2 type transport system ATP-binding protein
VEATTQGHRVTVITSDSDAVARTLLYQLGGSNLEIISGSLESAFMTITAPARGAGTEQEGSR